MKLEYTPKYDRARLINEELLIRASLKDEKSIDAAKIKLENSRNKCDVIGCKRPILFSRISLKRDDTPT